MGNVCWARSVRPIESTMSSPVQLHPEAQVLVDQMAQSNSPPFHTLTVEQTREASRMQSIPPVAGHFEYDGERSEYFVPLPDSIVTIPIYVYKPANLDQNAPILIFFHGGGLVVGSRANVEVPCQIISNAVKCVVVNVEYRLAPEHKFPIPFNDCCMLAQWVLHNRTTLGGSRQCKVGVIGDSAGGSLAASVAHDVPGLAFEILIYPRLNALGNYYGLKSYEEYKDGPLLTRDMLRWFDSKIAEPAEYKNPRIASLLRPDFGNLPPTLFIVAECDPIRDDSNEYVKKLTDAGVQTEFYLIKGAIHLFYTLPGAFPVLTKDVYEKTCAFIKKWGF